MTTARRIAQIVEPNGFIRHDEPGFLGWHRVHQDAIFDAPVPEAKTSSMRSTERRPVMDPYELIGGYGTAKEILTLPLGAVGFARFAGTDRTVFLRAHDDVATDSTGVTSTVASAYLAERDDYGTIENLVRDSHATLDRKHGDILAFEITTEEVRPLCRYDDSLTSDEDEHEENHGVFGNANVLSESIAALPPGRGFLIGNYESAFSDFTLGLRTADGFLHSGCGPSITSEAFSDFEDMSDIPDDARAEAASVDILAAHTAVDPG